MSTETIKDTRLFTDLQGGRIACYDHLGGYGRHAVEVNPNGEVEVGGVMVWITPLDMLTVMTDADRAEFARSMAEYGMPGLVAECEDCRHEVKS